jgi:hypothetical protein
MPASSATIDNRPCGYPIACALCGEGLNRWYYGGRAPLCARCNGKEGPVRHPEQWGPPEHFSPAALAVRNSYLSN